jgi:hypothetical protein
MDMMEQEPRTILLSDVLFESPDEVEQLCDCEDSECGKQVMYALNEEGDEIEIEMKPYRLIAGINVRHNNPSKKEVAEFTRILEGILDRCGPSNEVLGTRVEQSQIHAMLGFSSKKEALIAQWSLMNIKSATQLLHTEKSSLN